MMCDFIIHKISRLHFSDKVNMDISTTQVMILANKIKDTIEVSLNPMASQIERTKAYQV